MSQESVELVVAALEQWSSGDETGALESFAPEVEYHHNVRAGTPLEGIPWTGDHARALEAVGLSE